MGLVDKQAATAVEHSTSSVSKKIQKSSYSPNHIPLDQRYPFAFLPAPDAPTPVGTNLKQPSPNLDRLDIEKSLAEGEEKGRNSYRDVFLMRKGWMVSTSAL